jgi:hypothetical protein
MNAQTLRRAVVALTVAGSISSLTAAGPSPKEVPVTSVVKDTDVSVAPALTILSDAGGEYINSKTLTSLIQPVGDWVLDAINPAKATRRIFVDFSQPVLGSGPNGGDPIGPPMGTYPFRALALCANYGNTLPSFIAGQVGTCGLRIGLDVGTRHFVIVMHPNGTIQGNFAETQAATVTCTSTGSGPCSEWRFTSTGTASAPGRNVSRLLELDSRNNVIADHGDFYMSFSITITK